MIDHLMSSTASWVFFHSSLGNPLSPMDAAEKRAVVRFCEGAIEWHAAQEAFNRSRNEAGVAGG
jgi:hypothetical protein